MERRSINFSFLTGFIVGSMLINVFHIVGDDEAEQVKKAQVRNHEVKAELDQQFDPVSNLVLDLYDESFQFQTTTDDGQETCTGDYRTQNGVATLSGNVVCSRIVETEEK